MASKTSLLNSPPKNLVRLTMLLAGLSLGLGSVMEAQKTPTPEQQQEAVIKVLDKVLPAVVTILAGPYSGSGVIIDGDKGYALTNEHVVHGETYVTVILLNGQRIDGSVVRSTTKLDLAIIKITIHEPLPEAVFGDSHKVRTSDPVLAMGAPKGLNSTVTMGEITKPRSRFTFKNNSVDWMVIHSAPINPGNSGGPLVNLKGEIIGLNSMLVIRGSGNRAPLYYAVSSHEVKSFADSFIPYRHTGRPDPPVSSKYLLARPEAGGTDGLSSSPVQRLGFRRDQTGPSDTSLAVPERVKPQTPPLKPYLGLTLEPLAVDSATKTGVNPYMNYHQITWLDPNGPAARAGLMIGDIMVSLNDRTIGSLADYEAIMSSAVVGGATWAEVVRRGQNEMIPLTIGGVEK